jgi:carbamate kinase
MRVVIALGGNALLQRGQKLSIENQRANVVHAASAIAAVINEGHEVVITHGNGPQVGLMALQDAAYDQTVASPLDVLIAESAGMIGYLIEQELSNLFPPDKRFVALLTEVEVDPEDPAFQKPSKPVGPVYSKEEADKAAKLHAWTVGPDGDKFRRLVASPRPKRIRHVEVIEALVRQGVTVICAGGGGIPVAPVEGGKYIGIEAVIDKDHSSALLATEIEADAFLIMTDVDGVFRDWGTPRQTRIDAISVDDVGRYDFPAGSMGPKVEAAAAFVKSGGKFSAIGKLDDALGMLRGKAGTIVRNDAWSAD